MDELLPYIPTDRRHALARGEDLPDRARGSALFVDISGFTPLAESLALDLGPQRGAEELTVYLNQVYDALIAELDRFRGSVIGFSGDAVTCWFDRDHGLIAAACALQMHETMEQFSSIDLPTGEQIPLTVKAGIAAGEARRFLVGDPDRQLLDVLAGSLLDEMAEAEHHAERGDVVLGPSAIQALGDSVKISRNQRGDSSDFGVVGELSNPVDANPWPDVKQGSLTDEKLRPWLLAPVYERLQAGQGEFLAELRPAVAEFVRFEGIDYDEDESAGRKLDDFVRRIQRIISSYDGTMVDITTGDKGSHLYLAFGAPVAHEDDVERAAALALDVCSEADHLDYITSVQIGINRGRMRTGAYGGKTRRTYGVLGDATNLAARLMMAAEPGEVLASQTVYEKAELSFRWKKRPAIKVKGKEVPIEVASLIERSEARMQDRAARQHLLPMVGRESEMSTIEEKIERAMDGQGQIVGITAEAGMGKSRLTAEAVRSARAQGLSVYQGECKSYGTQSSYLVWSTIWRDIFRLEADVPIGTQLSSLEDRVIQLSSALLPRVPLLGPLLNIHIPDNDLTSQFEAKLRKTSLEAMLEELLQARASTSPLVMVLEDTHWLDPLSSDLLDVLARAIAGLPVLLLLAYRPDDDSQREHARVAEQSHFTEIQLTHLSHEQAEQWITIKALQLYGPEEDPPPEFTSRLIERADGNPFYIEETLNYLKDNELSIGEADSLAQINLPASLNSLVLTRIDRLSDRPRTTLRVASVFGRSFKASLLSGAHPEAEDTERIADELAELDRKGFVVVESQAEESYLFKHSVIQEVAYESLPFGTRHNLHRKIGDFIEDTYKDSLGEQTDLLAHHFFSGEAWPKALDYKLDAARQALSKYANDIAISSAQDALIAGERSDMDPSETSVKLLSAHEILGEVLGIVGQYRDSLEHYGIARALAASAPPLKGTRDSRLAQLCQATASVHERRSEFDLALEWVERGLLRVSTSEPSIQEVWLLILKSGIFTRLAQYEEAERWAERGLKLASEIQTREGEQAVAQVNYLLGGIYYRQGAVDLAVDYCEKSVDAYEQLDDILGQRRAYNNLGSTYRLMGDLTLASEILQKPLEISRRTGDIQGQGNVTNNLGNIYLDQERWEEAAEHFQESNSIWQRLGAVLPEAITLSNLGAVYIGQGVYDEARTALERSQSLFEQAGSDSFMPELHRRWAQYYLAVNDKDNALRSIQSSMKVAQQQEAQLERGISLRVKAEVDISHSDYDAAATALDESLEILEEQDSDHETAMSILVSAQMADHAGTTVEKSRADWAAGTFKRLGVERKYEEMLQLKEDLGRRDQLI